MMTPRFHNRSPSATNSFIEPLCTAGRKLQPTHFALGEPTAHPCTHPDRFSNCIDLTESNSRAVWGVVRKF